MSLIGGRVSSVALAATLFAAPSVRADLTLHQSLENNRAGQISTEARTVYIKGKRQKTDSQDRSLIYDLDRGVLIDVDKEHKAYREVLFAKLPHSSGTSISYRKKGRVKTIAGFKCELYEVTHAGNEDIAERACYSESVPNAQEATDFGVMFLTALTRPHAKRHFPPAGVALLSEASSEEPPLRVPSNLSEEEQQRIRDYIAEHPEEKGGKMVTTIVVESVETTAIDDGEFSPPKDYKKIVPRKSGSKGRGWSL